MGGLIHTGLGSSSLIAHVLHSPPSPPAKQLYHRSCSNKHTHGVPVCFLRLHTWRTRHSQPLFDAKTRVLKSGSLGRLVIWRTVKTTTPRASLWQMPWRCARAVVHGCHRVPLVLFRQPLCPSNRFLLTDMLASCRWFRLLRLSAQAVQKRGGGSLFVV